LQNPGWLRLPDLIVFLHFTVFCDPLSITLTAEFPHDTMRVNATVIDCSLSIAYVDVACAMSTTRSKVHRSGNMKSRCRSGKASVLGFKRRVVPAISNHLKNGGLSCFRTVTAKSDAAIVDIVVIYNAVN
jgi:hypothetical protein